MIIEAREDTITLRGEVKTNIWPAIQAAAAVLLENHPKGIIIDCSGLSKITAKGAETFQDAFTFIASQNARIVVSGLTDEMVAIGQSVPGFRSQLPIAASVEEARASLELSEVTPHRGKARVAGVVPMLGNWRRSVYLADRLAVGENCEIHLVDLIRVPRTLPVGSPMPEREAAGQDRLAEAQGIVRKTGLKSFSHVERVRTKTALADFAERLHADFAVISLDCDADKGTPYIDEQEALSLQETAPLEVSLVKGSPKVHNAAPDKVLVPAVGAWEHAVEHVCKLVAGTFTEVTVVYVIPVHRTEPLDAPKPDADAAAADCAREAARIAKRHGVRIHAASERVRDTVLGFVKMVETGGYDLTVVGMGQETAAGYEVAHSIAVALLDEVPCEVILLRTSPR